MGRARTRATEIVDNVDRRPKRQWGPATTTARARGLRAKTSAGRERTVPPSCGKECRRGVGTTATGTRRSEARGAKTWTPAVAASRLDASPRCLQALVLKQCCSCGWVPGSVHTAWNPSTTTHRPPLCFLHLQPIFLARCTSTDPDPISMQSRTRIVCLILAIVAMRLDRRPAMRKSEASPELGGRGVGLRAQ